MRRYLTEPETPIAEKPFARGQRRRYLGRRFFAAAGGARRAIDVWGIGLRLRLGVSRVRLPRVFEIPDPAPGQCRACRWEAKLTAKREVKSVAKSISRKCFVETCPRARRADVGLKACRGGRNTGRPPMRGFLIFCIADVPFVFRNVHM